MSFLQLYSLPKKNLNTNTHIHTHTSQNRFLPPRLQSCLEMVLDKEIFKKNFIFSPNNLYRRYPVKTRISTDISRVRLQRYDRNVYAVITERKQYATPRRNKTTAKSKLHRTPGPFYTPVHVITTRKRFPLSRGRRHNYSAAHLI